MTQQVPGRIVRYTPESLMKVPLRDARGRRGYAKDDVDNLLRHAAQDLETQAETITKLTSELWWMKQGLKDPDFVHVRRASAAAIETAQSAQRAADAMVATARMQSRQMVAAAQQHADEIYQQAKAAADRAAVDYRRSAGRGYRPEQEAVVRDTAAVAVLVDALRAAAEQGDVEIRTVISVMNEGRWISAP